MTTDRLSIGLDERESRYDRQERITWWDQRRLLASRVLVVGAGALGNEIVKNLALVGVGHLCVVDMDRIEHANLSRCVFFRSGDAGEYKAEVLAKRAREANPEVTVENRTCRIERLGLGFVARFDLVVCGLDNRETRAWVNQACRKAGMTWIDGAIEGLQGLVRVFGPDGPCYECTLGQSDRQAMAHRRSCALLSPADILEGKVPTNATTSSVVAGVQSQETVKLLVGRPDLVALRGRAWVFNGESMLSYTIEYVEDEFCMAHDRYTPDWAHPRHINAVRDLVNSQDVAVDFEDDLITLHDCETCGSPGRIGFRSGLPPGAGQCSQCGSSRRVESRTSILATDPMVDVPWAQLSPPEMDVVSIRTETDRHHVVVAYKEDS